MKRIKSVGIDYIEITGTIEAETEKAILLNDGNLTRWLPKSQCEDIERQEKGVVVVTMPEWLAINKEFI